MDIRMRDEKGIIKIGVVDLFSNGKEDAIKPFTMMGNSNKSWESHPDNIIKVLRNIVPNAEIYLVPNTDEGIQYLIDVGCVIVNISLAGYGESKKYNKLSERAFVVCGAGNSGEKGESWLSLQNYACAVGAIDERLKPMYYSSYGKDAVKTVAIEPIVEGKTLHGTSFTTPVIVGLLAQWYIWHFDTTGFYPSIKQTNDFIKINSHDIFDEGKDSKTGYGLLRLPEQFKVTQIIARIGNRYGTKIKHFEGEASIGSQVDLLIAPYIKDSRTMIGLNGVATSLGANVKWDGENESVHCMI